MKVTITITQKWNFKIEARNIALYTKSEPKNE